MDFRLADVLRIRIPRGEEIALGPGKAALLEAIHRCGSISGAGRDLGMSYRKAWLMVDQMNQCFREPLVISVKGGTKGGGARITDLGLRVLSAYRETEATAWKALQPGLKGLGALLKRA
jgi:molybdate transport system regulatory protein